MARILFVTQTAHPLGGVEAWLDDLAPALAADHHVTVGLVRGRRFHDPARYMAARSMRTPTIEIDGRTGTTEGRVRAVVKAIHTVNADLVVPVNVADVLEAVRREKARGRNLRLLYPLHGVGADYLLDVLEFRGIIDVGATMSRLAERALIEAGRLDRSRVKYVNYGVAAAGQAPAFSGMTSLRLIYVGRLTQDQKRILDLVPLCSALEKRGVAFQLEIVGSGPQENALREALGAKRHVHFLGPLSREELYQRVYPNAAALVLLSEWETGPIVAWEAMRHGATIVTTEYLGLRAEKRLRDGENALVAPVGDVETLASAIERLARDPALLARLRRAAYATAERELRIENSLAAWRSLVDQCLALAPATDTRPVRLPESRGRLDRIAGPFAESIRRVLGIGMVHADSGGEWPHSYHFGDPRSAETDAAIASLDL